MAGECVDLFAGPGGWDLAARELGLDPLGVEFDDAACATREAAGLRTVQADVSALEPLDFAPCAGLIASPPCQAFSMAGKGAGRRALPAYASALVELAEGRGVDHEALDAECGDPRGHLVLEPLRWALALKPRWIACEQVKPVLPLWEAMANVLAAYAGYWVWAGVLSAERFGVPQTRERAFMVASLDGPVGAPPATHQRYVPPRKADEQTLGLFDVPEPTRIVHPQDRQLLPWVSMAEALGWGMTARPSVTYTASAERYGAKPLGSGSGAQRTLDRAREAGEWDPQDRVGFPRRSDSDTGWDYETAPRFTSENGVEYRERDLRAASEPAFALTEKVRSWTRFRPATTVAGDPRVFPPGHKINADDIAAGRGGQQRSGAGWTDTRPAPTIVGGRRSKDGAIVGRQLPAGEDESRGGWSDVADAPRNSGQAVRVSLAEALVLQSFPSDYPVRGTRTKQFEQVGNAVPPLLAWSVLRAVV